MSTSTNQYVYRLPTGGYRVQGTRVSLDSIAHAYWEGRSPEAIAADFPSLSLEQIHGAIAFYLGHQDEVDAYISEQDNRWREFQRESEAQHGPLLRRIRQTALAASGN